MSGLKKYIWCAFIPSLILWGVLQFALRGFVSNINANYILSSITQGLASLVALLFVIIFFLCQSTGRVSVLDRVLKPDGYVLLGIFVGAIMFPLIVMKIGPTDVLVNISISWAAFSIISLFPFIMAVNDRMKEFGIRNILANLEINRSSESRLKYTELIDDLLEISPKEILKLETDTTIKSLITELHNAIESGLINPHLMETSMIMMSQIGNRSFKEEAKEVHFNKIKQIIGGGLKGNCPTPGITVYGNERKELCELYRIGLSELLFGIKLDKERCNEIRLSFAKIIIEPSLLIFDYLENGKNGTLKKNQEKLEESMLSFSKEGKITAEEYIKALDDLKSQHTHIEDGIISKFENRLKSLLNSNE